MVVLYPIEIYVLTAHKISQELFAYESLIEQFLTPGIYNWKKEEISKPKFKELLDNKYPAPFLIRFLNKYLLSIVISSVDEKYYPDMITFGYCEENRIYDIGEDSYDDIKKLIYILYNHFNPLFVRTGAMEHYGWPELIEKNTKKINQIHWMQILSKEIRENLKIKDLKDVAKICYELEELSDGGIYLRPMKELAGFGITNVLTELMNVEFPWYLK